VHVDRCEVPCVCTVCNSHQHTEHTCFIAHGVPKQARMAAADVLECLRLHELYCKGEFDWRSTATSLRWLRAVQRRAAAVAAAAAARQTAEVLEALAQDVLADAEHAQACVAAACDPASDEYEWAMGLYSPTMEAELDALGVHGDAREAAVRVCEQSRLSREAAAAAIDARAVVAAARDAEAAADLLEAAAARDGPARSDGSVMAALAAELAHWGCAPDGADACCSDAELEAMGLSLAQQEAAAVAHAIAETAPALADELAHWGLAPDGSDACCTDAELTALGLSRERQAAAAVDPRAYAMVYGGVAELAAVWSPWWHRLLQSSWWVAD
jgi:hypothetical protein